MPAPRSLTCAAALLLAGGLLTALGPAGPAAAADVARAPGPGGGADLFDVVDGFGIDTSRDATVRPDAFTGLRLDLSAARTALAAAPDLATARRGAAAPADVVLTDPDGRSVAFAVSEDSVLAPGLQARHPDVRTYAGRSVDDPTTTVRLDLTPAGFHASVRSPGGQDAWYVDPAYRDGGSAYLSYYGADVPADQEGFVERGPEDTARVIAAAPARTAPGAAVTRRTFRLAFVTDPTYATYYGGADGVGSDAEVLAAKATLVNRVDQVYNDDLAIRFELVAGTDALNLATRAEATEPDGPCGPSACYDADTFYGDGTTGQDGPDQPDGCTGDLLTRNTFVLGQLVGADRYDLGHIGLGVNGGGIAGLGVVGTSDKAQGCTGLSKPQGDFYAVDYVAHEFGHQMGGNHTFNGTRRNCATTNRNAGTSVEPGSGSSVMAYAGICGSDDLQPHSDPYFSQRSIDEITDTVAAASVSADEVQTVALEGFDVDGDSVTLTYPGAPSQTLTRGPGYQLQVTAAVRALTGCTLPEVSGYDAGADTALPAATDDGFTVTFGTTSGCAGRDLQRIGVGATTGGVTASVGVQVDGGASTNGGAATATANRAPSVTAPADRTIPVRTPFTLTGSGRDADGDPLTYLWEQNDEAGPNGTSLVSNTKPDGPLFRVFGTRAEVSTDDALQSPSPGRNVATTDASRTFPDLAQVLDGNTNAATGQCPATPEGDDVVVPDALVDCYSEFLPTAGYDLLGGGTLDFRLTARDGALGGGGTQADDVILTVDPLAGPLAVTSRESAGTPASAGSAETVAWAVNGTDAAGLAPTVRLLLSTDGGMTYPEVLADETPNDGTQVVTLPDVDTDTARVKVEAVGNYFFDVNDADFAIRGPATPTPPTTTPGAVPQTTITAGPAEGRFRASYRARYAFSSDVAGSTFRCALDGQPVSCGAGAATLRRLKPGDHAFTVAATSSAGRTDPTPALRRFTTVGNEQVLTRGPGWRSLKDARAYRGTYLTASSPRRVLSLKVRQARRVAVLVSRAPGFGRLAVTVDGRRVAVVRTAAPRARTKQLVVVSRFARPTNATVRLTTLSGRPVQVDGIGVSRR